MKNLANLPAVMVVVGILFACPAQASDYSVKMPPPAIKGAKADRAETSAGMNRKLGRGLSNLTMGWLEIFKGIEHIDKTEGGVAALSWGPIYGLGNAIARTATGLFETVTFPIPVRGGYDPLIDPEFVLEKPDETILSDPVTK